MESISLSEVTKFKPEMNTWPQGEAEEFVKLINQYDEHYKPVLQKLQELLQIQSNSTAIAEDVYNNSPNIISWSQAVKHDQNLLLWTKMKAWSSLKI